MVKKYILIAVLALSNVPESHAFRAGFLKNAFAHVKLAANNTLKSNFFRKESWKNAATKVKNIVSDEAFKESLAHLGLGCGITIPLAVAVSDGKPFKNQASTDHLIDLDDDAQAMPIIKDVLKTYLPEEKKEIQFYREKEFEDYCLSDGSIMMNAYARPDSKIVLSTSNSWDAIKDPNHSQHLQARSLLGHEIGHVVNFHGSKKEVFPALSFLGTYSGICYSLYKGFPNALGLILKKPLFSFVPALFVCPLSWFFSSRFMTKAYSRFHEREADLHVIKHAKDWREIAASASNHFALSSDPVRKAYFESFEGRWLCTHPSDAERAAYFSKAAKELKAKQAQGGALFRHTLLSNTPTDHKK